MNSLLIGIVVLSILFYIVNCIRHHLFIQKVNSLYNESYNEKKIINILFRLKKQEQFNVFFALCDKYLINNPKLSLVRYILAKSLYLKKKDLEKSEKHFNILLESMPNKIKLLSFLGEIYFKASKFNDAINYYLRILSIDANNKLTLKRLIKIYLMRNQKHSAANLLERLLDIETNIVQKNTLLNKLFFLYIDIEKWEEALDLLTQMPQSSLKNKKILKNIAKIYEKKKDYENLEKIYEKLIEVEFDNEVILKKVIELNIKINNIDKAKFVIKNALLNDRYRSDSYFEKSLCEIYLKECNYEKAYEIIKFCDKKNVSDIDSKRLMIKVLEKLGKFEELIEKQKEIIDLCEVVDFEEENSNLSYYYCLWSEKLICNREFEEGIEKLYESISINPNNDKVYFNLGVINREIRNFFEALKAVKHAIELNPSEVIYYNELGRLYLELEDFKRAKDAYLDAIAIDPENYIAHCNLGYLLSKENKLELSLKHFKIALKYNPKNYNILYNIGLIYDIKNEIEKALKYYGMVLKIKSDHSETLNNMEIINMNMREIRQKNVYKKI